MSKKDKAKEIWDNYTIFATYVRSKVKKEIEKGKSAGKRPTAGQIEETRKKYTKRARRMGVKVIALILTIGTANLETGNITKTNQQQRIEKIGQQTTWKDNIKVKVNLQSDIKENIEEEINKLSTSKEILQYIKQQYVNEYNKNNEQKIKAKEIQITKSNLGEIEEDDLNGKCTYDPNKNTENRGVYTITRKGKIIEDIARAEMDEDYKQAHRYGTKTKKYNTEKIYATIAEGIDYCIGYDNYQKGNTSEQILLTYKERLINRIYEK